MARGAYRVSRRYNHTLAKAAKALPQAVDVIIFKSLDDGKEFAIQIVAKDTTRLAKTIRVEKIGTLHYRLTAGNMTGFDGKFVDYHIFVEREQPYLSPAMMVVKQNLEARMVSLQRFLDL